MATSRRLSNQSTASKGLKSAAGLVLTDCLSRSQCALQSWGDWSSSSVMPGQFGISGITATFWVALPGVAHA